MNFEDLLIRVITNEGKEHNFYKTNYFMHHADACKEIAKLNLTDVKPNFFVYNYLGSISKNGHIAFMRDSFDFCKFGLLFLPNELSKEQYLKLKELLLTIKDYNIEITMFNGDQEINILNPNLKYCEQEFNINDYCKIKKC